MGLFYKQFELPKNISKYYYFILISCFIFYTIFIFAIDNPNNPYSFGFGLSFALAVLIFVSYSSLVVLITSIIFFILYFVSRKNAKRKNKH